MCLAIPGKVLEIYEQNGIKMGKLDYAGVENEACLEYIPEIKIGEYAIVHAGFGISILNEEEAKLTLDTWDEVLEAAARENLAPFGNSEDDPQA